MTRRSALIAALLCCIWTRAAIGDVVAGTVMNEEGDTVGGATVVLTHGGAVTTTTTDPRGKFRFSGVPSGAIRLLAINGTKTTELAGELDASERPFILVVHANVETIQIDELPPATVLPKIDASTIPRRMPYSDEAIDRNSWAVIWVNVLIDREGKVFRARVLKSPAGMDLDDIALAQAMKVRYQPARDQNGQTIPSQAVFVLEWPNYWGGPLPPCRGSGPLTEEAESFGASYRDCDPPKGYERYRLPDFRPKLRPPSRLR